jgi:hypothetical protein
VYPSFGSEGIVELLDELQLAGGGDGKQAANETVDANDKITERIIFCVINRRA